MSKTINKLTPEQEAKIPEYVEKYREIGLSTRKTDRVKAEDAISRSYAYLKLKAPSFIWAASPFAGAEIAAKLATGKDVVTKEEISAQASKASYGSFEACWVCFYAFITEQLPVEHDGLIHIVKDIIDECGVYWTFEDTVVLTDKPTKISMKDGVLHSEEGKALEYADGTGIVAIKGKRFASLLEANLASKLEDGNTELQNTGV